MAYKEVIQSFNIINLIGDVDYHNLKEELQTCKQFLAVSELENGKTQSI